MNGSAILTEKRARLLGQAYWNQPHMSRETAEDLLSTCQRDTFVVRKSSKRGCLAISVRLAEEKRTLHVLAARRKDGSYSVRGQEGVRFKDVYSLSMANALLTAEPFNSASTRSKRSSFVRFEDCEDLESNFGESESDFYSDEETLRSLEDAECPAKTEN